MIDMHGCRPITLDRGPDYFLAHRFDDSERGIQSKAHCYMWFDSEGTDCFTDLSSMGSARRLRSASIAAPRWIAALCT